MSAHPNVKLCPLNVTPYAGVSIDPVRFGRRAGWSYLLLTWGLPHSNGTFVLTAIAWDKEGRHTILGTKTITVTNATGLASSQS